MNPLFNHINSIKLLTDVSTTKLRPACKIQAYTLTAMSHFIQYSWLRTTQDFINVYVSQHKKLVRGIPCV